MSFKSVVFCILILLSVSLPAFAFPFEEYEWGDSAVDVRGLVTSNGKDITSGENEPVIKYADNLFGKPCSVTFYFSPESDQLAMVEIIWDDPSILPEIKNILSDKYGPAHQASEAVEKYAWYGEDENDAIKLESSYNSTKLDYLGGKYYAVFVKEQDALAQNDANKL